MSSSNYDGNFPYWNNNNLEYNMYGDQSSGTSSQFNQFSFSENPQFDTTLTFHHQNNLPVIDIDEAVKGESKLGLKLTKTPSLLNIVSGFKTSSGGKKKQKEDDLASSSDKLKASNFSALSIQIGSWKRESRHEGDLVAKCYFKKRKLVWEVLDGNLKTKIEFLWSNILAIKQRTSHADNTRILEILLERSPLFFNEVNPQPRKHTNWEQTNDFTNNQASLNRKHTLEFAPGILEKHFDKIVQADPKLQRLSQQPWPNHISPYFHEIRFTNGVDFNHSPITSTFPPHYSFDPTITSGNSTHIEGMNSSQITHSDFFPSTNYQSHDASFNQNVSPYQNLEQGELNINGDDHPHGLPNLYNNQSQFYTSSDVGEINQHVSYVQEEQQLSYDPSSFPYSYANSETQDVGYYQSNNDYQSQYYYDAGGNQWQ
ncbi:uncharacterized protein LOC141656161 [Silene latifolia]|uniref:uncharacterized protein LOC141656161 n=1 Tax=Silene latifolia TaxID=37657 RepID=UPI003D76C767